MRLQFQPGSVPTFVHGDVAAEFFLVALEISLQKGCVGCLSLILFFLHV